MLFAGVVVVLVRSKFFLVGFESAIVMAAVLAVVVLFGNMDQLGPAAVAN